MIPECDCTTWAVVDMTAMHFGNGHNPACAKFIPYVGGLDVLKKLVDGIRRWGALEDGIPDEVWDAYKHGVFITEGKILNSEHS